MEDLFSVLKVWLNSVNSGELSSFSERECHDYSGLDWITSNSVENGVKEGIEMGLS